MQCRHNAVGRTKIGDGDAECVVSDPPSPPRNVLADDVTKASCKLTWEPPETDNGSPVTGYMVERCEGKSTRWSKLTKDPVTERRLDVGDLLAGESYQFRVCAVNAAGVSKPSDASTPFVAKVGRPVFVY